MENPPTSHAVSERTRLRHMPARAIYDKALIAAILDEGIVAHLAFAIEGQPYAIPTLQARGGDRLPPWFESPNGSCQAAGRR